MTGACVDGSPAISSKVDAAEYRGQFESSHAKRLRRGMLKALRAANYTAEQIAQITNWGSRTVRRDLANPDAGIAPLKIDLDHDLDQPENQEPATCRAKGRLSVSEYRDLLAEYSEEHLAELGVAEEARPDIVDFLNRIAE